MQENHWYNISSARTYLISSNKVCVLRSVSLLLYIRPFSEKGLYAVFTLYSLSYPKNMLLQYNIFDFEKICFFFLVGMSVDMGRHDQTHSPTSKILRN